MAANLTVAPAPVALIRGRTYRFYIVGFMGIVALMDQYLSVIESTAIPSILAEYQITAADFASLKARFLIVTFFVFALIACAHEVAESTAGLACKIVVQGQLRGDLAGLCAIPRLQNRSHTSMP